jgi:hypothetical protein
MIDKEIARQNKEQRIAAAFTAWLQGAGAGKDFDEFLYGCGLGKKAKQLSPESKKKLVNKSKAIEERVLKKMARIRKN